jgi:glutaminyl-peptide cyclotransferase
MSSPLLPSRYFCGIGSVWFFSLFFMVSSCKPSDTPTPVEPQNRQANPAPANVSAPNASPSRRDKIWIDFDGRQAMEEAKTLAAFGPRPSGTDANRQVRQHLADRLTNLGWQTTEQQLTEHAPDGRQIEFCNLVARYSRYPLSPKRILIGAHFDTPPMQEFQASGASDGAANTAVLIELARTLALDPALASNVDLLFLDGDAPFHELNLSDGLFGSRFYAQMLRIDRRAADIRAAILVDNIGGPRLNFAPNSDPHLKNALQKAASAVGVKLEPANRSFLADHVPFAQAGIPSILLLDADSPFLNTADDTADRLDEGALAKTGILILYFAAHEIATQ